MTVPDNGGIQLDVKTAPSYEFIAWTVNRSILAPHLGVDFRQGWPYAPYQEMIDVLPHAAQASMFFLCMLVLTLLICNASVEYRQVALAAVLFMIPFLVLMAGGVPHLASITPPEYAGFETKMLPLLSLPVLLIAYFTLKKLRLLQLILILFMMAFFIGGYPLVWLILDEKKRNAYTAIIQAGMIAYVFLLTLILRVRSTLRSKTRTGERL